MGEKPKQIGPPGALRLSFALWYPKPAQSSTASLGTAFRAIADCLEGYIQMRLKLVLISSLIAAIVGAGSVIAIITVAFSSLKPISTPGLLVVSTYLVPALATLLAAIFVYRHTARRRRLQAALTAVVALLLTIASLLIASILSAHREPAQPRPQPQQTVSRL